MAKPKAMKVADGWALRDLFHADKVRDGDRVCFVVPKHPHRKGKRKWGFVRGRLRISYRTYCECCGPEFSAHLEGQDGKVKMDWH